MPKLSDQHMKWKQAILQVVKAHTVPCFRCQSLFLPQAQSVFQKNQADPVLKPGPVWHLTDMLRLRVYQKESSTRNMLPAQPLQLHVCQGAIGLSLVLHATNSKLWCAECLWQLESSWLCIRLCIHNWVLHVSVLTCEQFLFVTRFSTRWRGFYENRYKPRGKDFMCGGL